MIQHRLEKGIHKWKSNSAVLRSPLTLLLQVPLPTVFASCYTFFSFYAVHITYSVAYTVHIWICVPICSCYIYVIVLPYWFIFHSVNYIFSWWDDSTGHWSVKRSANPDFADQLTFPLAPPRDWPFLVLSEMSQLSDGFLWYTVCSYCQRWTVGY